MPIKLTAEHVKSLLEYDSGTGIFVWKYRPNLKHGWNFRNAGKVAGHLDVKGYRIIGIGNKHYQAHTLAWLYHYGEWPIGVDHINNNQSDNRIVNLRLATQAQNMCNRVQTKKIQNRTSRFKNVFKPKGSKKFCVQVAEQHRGVFLNEIDAAICANINAAYEFGEFARPNVIPEDEYLHRWWK